MKESFHQVFTDGSRKTVSDWQNDIKRYIFHLSKGHLSDELYPTSLKQLTREQAEMSKVPWRNCCYCGKGFASNMEDDKPTCPDCFKAMRYKTKNARSARLAKSSRLAGGGH